MHEVPGPERQSQLLFSNRSANEAPATESLSSCYASCPAVRLPHHLRRQLVIRRCPEAYLPPSLNVYIAVSCMERVYKQRVKLQLKHRAQEQHRNHIR